MNIDVTIDYPIDAAIKEATGKDAPPWQDGVIAVDGQDRLFVGGGCEALMDPGPGEDIPGREFMNKRNARISQNVSVCVHHPKDFAFR